MDDMITIVPVRLGSRRVRLKSLRLLNERPLIEYILETLKSTRHHNDIYINSDSTIYEQVAKANAVKFYKRDPSLASSESLIDDYLYDFIKDKQPRYLAVVNPTSPFVSSRYLDDAYEYYMAGGIDTLLSCEHIQTHCFYQGEAINFSTNGKHPRSQDLEPIKALNFAITIFDCKKFIENYERHGYGVYTGKLGFFETKGIESIDIDYEDDFIFAEFVARFLDSPERSIEARYSKLAKDIIDNDIDVSN